MSRFYIKNPKWKISHISADTKLDVEERTIERRTRKHLGFQPTTKGTYHRYNNRMKRAWQSGMFDSGEEFR